MSIFLINRFSLVSALILLTSSHLIANLPALAQSSISNTSGIREAYPENLPGYIIAQSRYAFTVTYIYSGTRNIKLKSVATGNEFDVYYASPIEPEVGDIITVIIENDRWITLINERTGKSSAVTSARRL
ncbi:MAG: hypothetical protein WAN66_04815 [Limnoraphis robusta]|uniref:SH3b domain-containing protein n=1 Tax=Limnoraphis robusta CS-951 TaxID=1637645 RepID=A0A0F5YM71_9CYAN|nr:hypothetical protein [Limnoraphis robusta]KKD39270.1 hypothetical protein WN50_04295 [Limnoraphis robusta CS-951]